MRANSFGKDESVILPERLFIIDEAGKVVGDPKVPHRGIAAAVLAMRAARQAPDSAKLRFAIVDPAKSGINLVPVSEKVAIWTRDPGAYWRSRGFGYTDKIAMAGLFTIEEAHERTKHLSSARMFVDPKIPEADLDPSVTTAMIEEFIDAIPGENPKEGTVGWLMAHRAVSQVMKLIAERHSPSAISAIQRLEALVESVAKDIRPEAQATWAQKRLQILTALNEISRDMQDLKPNDKMPRFPHENPCAEIELPDPEPARPSMRA